MAHVKSHHAQQRTTAKPKPKGTAKRQPRECLGHGCTRTFMSEGNHQRLCPLCTARVKAQGTPEPVWTWPWISLD